MELSEGLSDTWVDARNCISVEFEAVYESLAIGHGLGGGLLGLPNWRRVVYKFGRV